MSAVLSECLTWRYLLERDVDLLLGGGTVAFVLLNPSTADAERDDPTLRRCKGFARRLAFARLQIVNLFAYRATDPFDLREAADPVGPENDGWVEQTCRNADLVIAGWGVHGGWHGRDRQVAEMLKPLELRCLGVTRDGAPRHPLYLSASSELAKWPA